MRTFQLYGPFNLLEFCKGESATETGESSGVYLWCGRLHDGSYKVRYVGQTIRSFAMRIYEEYKWDKANTTQRFDVQKFSNGRMVPITDDESPVDVYIDEWYRNTWLFLLPLRKEDSPLYGQACDVTLFKPAESAFMRSLQRDAELWAFTWNSEKRGIECHEPLFPCQIRCDARILGLGDWLDCESAFE